MKRNIQDTFLTNSLVIRPNGDKYLVLETCDHSNEILVMRMDTIEHTGRGKAYHYYNGVFTPVDLDADRTDGSYFGKGTINNCVE